MAKYPRMGVPPLPQDPGQSPWAHEEYVEQTETLAPDDVVDRVMEGIVEILKGLPGLHVRWVSKHVAREPPRSLPFCWVVREGISGVVFTNTSDVRRCDYTVQLLVAGDDHRQNKLLSGYAARIPDALSNVSIAGLTAPGWTQCGRVSTPRQGFQEDQAAEEFSGYFCFVYEHPEG